MIITLEKILNNLRLLVFFTLMAISGSFALVLAKLCKKLSVTIYPITTFVGAFRVFMLLFKVIFNVKVEIRNKEILENEKYPLIFMSKHQSFLDILYIVAVSRSTCFIAKKSLLKVPILKQMMKINGDIMIDREDSMSALRQIKKDSKKCLDAGRSICIFPEGSRSFGRQKLPYKTGGIIALCKANPDVKLVLVSLNSCLFWPKNQMPQKRGSKLIINVIEVIDTEGRNLKELAKEIEEKIENSYDEILEETVLDKSILKQTI